MRTPRPAAAVLAAALLAALCAAAADAPGPAPGTLVVVDAAGKEQKLTAWKFTAGTRRLGWLAPPPPAPGGPAAPARDAGGPEALAFREESSTMFAEGVLTLVPLDRLRALDYDAEKQTVTARVATGAKPDDDTVLTGSTRFRGVNKLALEAEVDKGELGVAEVKYLGGSPRGVRALRFPPPKPATPPAGGRPAVVTTAGKQPAAHKVTDLQPLYRLADGRERLAPLLMFKKTLKLDVARLKKLTAAGGEDDAWRVTPKEGGEETLTLLRAVPLDGQEAQLEGLLGRVPAGYKLFPPHTVAEVVFDATEPETKPEPKDDPN